LIPFAVAAAISSAVSKLMPSIEEASFSTPSGEANTSKRSNPDILFVTYYYDYDKG
jgi:hypothetical protein